MNIDGNAIIRAYNNYARWMAERAQLIEQQAREIHALRDVYEAARRFMRFNGVDRAKMLEALEQLDNAIAVVQQIDSGLTDDD